jgi:hypothetical protein
VIVYQQHGHGHRQIVPHTMGAHHRANPAPRPGRAREIPGRTPWLTPFRVRFAAPTLAGMTLRARIRRWHSPTLFALIGLCFLLLPFATASCDNAQTTFTGAELVTRTVPQGGVVNEPGYGCAADLSRCVQSQASTLATVALAAAILGLALGIFGIARGSGWCAATGLGALLLLFREALSTYADVRFHAGYNLALLLFLWAAVLHLQRAARRGLQQVRRRKDDLNPPAPSGIVRSM